MFKNKKLLFNKLNFKVDIYIFFLIIYYLAIFSFASFFFLIDEDIEIYKALLQIKETGILRSDMGYPYSPLSLYLFRIISFISGPEIIFQRLFVSALLTVSSIAIYLTYKQFLSKMSSFAFTFLSFAFIPFPFPRIEYFMEGSFLAIMIFFAVKHLLENKKKDLILSAIFASLAFFCKGYPHGILYLFIMPFALIVPNIILFFFNKNKTSEFKIIDYFKNLNPFIIFTFLILFYFVDFLKNKVYISFEFLPESISSFPLIKLFIFLLSALLVIYYFKNRMKNFYDILIKFNILKKLLLLFLSYLFVLIIFVILLLITGHSSSDIINYMYPGDIINDHESDLLQFFFRVIKFLFYFLITYISIILANKVIKEKINGTIIKLFIFFSIILIPVFIRFIQLYNMFFVLVYLLVIILVFLLYLIKSIEIIKPVLIKDYIYIKRSILFIVIIFSLLMNASFLIYQPLKRLYKNELINSNSSPAKYIYYDKKLYSFFQELNNFINILPENEKSFIIIGRTYVNYIPYIFEYKHFEDLNNVVVGLSRIRDINELYDFRLLTYEEILDGVDINSNISKLDKNINKYRNIALDKIKNTNYNFLIIPYNRQFGLKFTPLKLEKIIHDIENYKGEDVLLNFINKNFKFEKVIESNMPFKEGVVIFKRKFLKM